MMESKPCAVVASCTENHPEEIIKLILGVDVLPEPQVLEDGIKAFPWHIDTKYYTADVNLCSVEKKTLGSEEFAVSVEAIVIDFDSAINEGLTVAESWLSFLKEFEPEVQILLCDRCLDDPSCGVSKVAAQEWCVDRGFELVERNPELDPDWQVEQDWVETTGIPRVVQALHAHLWPNLRMKGKSQQLSRTVQSMLNGNDADSVPLDNAAHHVYPSSHLEDHIDELLGDSGGVAGFSSLFEQLSAMKQHVQGLPSEQRKACAEQVVLAFWRAIGGDEDELDS